MLGRAARLVVAVAVTLTLTLAGSASGVPVRGEPLDFAAYVDPFIGTAPAAGTGYALEFDGGDVFPGAVHPMGMLAWSPDTFEHRVPGGYYYPDRTLKGFSLTHFSGRGCTVYQDVPILPTIGDAPPATFSHANESAAPGAYSVTLDNGIQVDLGVTPRTGLGSITFPEGTAQGSISIDAAGSVNPVFNAQIAVDANQRLVTGSVESQVGCGTDHYTLYFAIAFDRAFTFTATGSGANLAFDTSTDRRVQLKPAISYVSVTNALANLASENPDWDLAAVRTAARSAWNDVLNRIEIQGGAADDLRVFYTALYHAFLHPNLFSDVNGEYIGFDDTVHSVPAGHAHYDDIAGWDQYRSLIQLRAILAPGETSDIMQSLVDDAAQGGGGMPRWEQANRNSAGMVGDSPDVLVADAYAFGAREFDARAALDALDYGASDVTAESGGHPVREYLRPWLELGYVPNQPSITLEYAADDFAVGQLATLLGDVDRAAKYAARSGNWVNTFDPVTGSIEPRNGDGTFVSPDPAQNCCGFVEGNAAQYMWMVPLDYERLFGLMGGAQSATARLDEFFTEVNAGPNRPYAWIGNEPSLVSPWAYDFAGAPARTQALVRRIQRALFSPTPGGLPGNDDGGTLSAWYVFSALGLYPAVPGVGGFAIGSPLFAEADVHLPGDRLLRIIGTGAAPDAPYASAISLNGAPYASAWIDWSQLSDGATLEFTLASSLSTGASTAASTE